jgi:hypothetical protein
MGALILDAAIDDAHIDSIPRDDLRAVQVSASFYEGVGSHPLQPACSAVDGASQDVPSPATCVPCKWAVHM